MLERDSSNVPIVQDCQVMAICRPARQLIACAILSGSLKKKGVDGLQRRSGGIGIRLRLCNPSQPLSDKTFVDGYTISVGKVSSWLERVSKTKEAIWKNDLSRKFRWEDSYLPRQNRDIILPEPHRPIDLSLSHK